MVKIASYVFFDIETTGLPHQERNKTKIIEFSFVATSRKDLENTKIGEKPDVSKITFLVNPQRKKINPVVSDMTGLTNKLLKNEPIFKEKVDTILSFLRKLPKPVCLIAHNGNMFDYRILLAEFMDINVSLPNDLLCVDSLIGFRTLHKQNYPKVSSGTNYSFEDSKDSEDWPDLNVSSEEWNEIDILLNSDIEPFDHSQESVKSSKSFEKNDKETNNVKESLSFKLPDLYTRLVGKKVVNCHRAEDDCMMLLECVIAAKEFLIWADKYCKNVYDIKPLVRY